MDTRNDNDYLSNLPDETLLKISDSFCARRDYITLPQTSSRFSLLFFNERQQALNNLRLLLSHGALGKLEDAEKIWRLYPDLLTCRGTIFHPNRSYVEEKAPVDIPFYLNPGWYKYINRTFYQILLMNSEFEEAEEVGKMMTQEEKQKQFDEVFPDGKIKKSNFDLEEAKKLLQAVFDVVAKDESLKIEIEYTNYNVKNIIMNEATREALYKLYAYAKPKSEHEMGLVFDPKFYHEALKLFDEKCSQFQRKQDRYTFWTICVEEWLAGCLGTGYLRPHAQGLGNSLTRRGCVLADGTPYFAFRRSSDSLPGVHFFIGYYGNRQTRAGGRLGAGVEGASFSKLMSNKGKSRDRLYAAICAPRNIVMSNSLK